LMPQAEHFPKAQRFLVTQRLMAAAFDFQEALYDANARSGHDRLAAISAADGYLDKLRLYLRLTHQWRWLSAGQYRHVSVMVAEVGRLLGGWKKQSAGR
jgi:hypothetical protein